MGCAVLVDDFERPDDFFLKTEDVDFEDVPAFLDVLRHARSRIEARMRCLKSFGERIMAIDPDRQTAEIHIRITGALAQTLSPRSGTKRSSDISEPSAHGAGVTMSVLWTGRSAPTAAGTSS